MPWAIGAGQGAVMDWAHILACETGAVDQELMLSLSRGRPAFARTSGLA